MDVIISNCVINLATDKDSVLREAFRVLKPGAHLVAFAAPKNVGHLQLAIEAAGFEVRDCLIDIVDLDPKIAAFVASLGDEQRADGQAVGLRAQRRV